tara:strand:- start:611 stop:1051 length:441 start_codon:yes stop_codon:yes gene_type:complete
MIMVDYKPEHIESILDGDMSKMARKSFGMAEDIAHGLFAPGLAFTGLIDGYVIASAGIKPLWPGVGEAWIVASDNMPKKKLSVIKLIKENFDRMIHDNGFVRVQACIRSDWPEAKRFAEFLGFEHEGIMKKYGPDGQDYLRMARVF